MNETQNTIEQKTNINKSEILGNLGKAPDALERVAELRIQKQKDEAAWQGKYNEAVNQNIDLGDKVEELTRKVNQVELEKKALDKALWRERSQKNITQEQELSEGQKIANMALEIVKRRTRERYGSNCKCDSCSYQVGGNNYGR